MHCLKICFEVLKHAVKLQSTNVNTHENPKIKFKIETAEKGNEKSMRHCYERSLLK